jgi:FemAB-related protein (PEP-CTERM system-associated)
MRIFLAKTEQDAKRWGEFVDRHPESSNYHRWGWKSVIEKSFDWPTYYLMAEEQGQIQGILPLVWQKSWMFGSFLTSLPFLNSGGVLAECPEIRGALVKEAISITKRVGARHLELRHRHHSELGLLTRTNKVAVVLEVEPDEAKMLKSFRHEVRTKIRKASKSGLATDICGAQALNEFYVVFAQNMRDLGTPVYSRTFFREILATFPSDIYICVVRFNNQPVAASFLTGFRDTLETLWGSSLRRYLPLAPNMLMYWRMLRLAADKGYRTFDFGRSSVGSGPHRFKLQWSTQEVPLYWHYWLSKGDHLPELNPDNPKYRMAIWLWQKLPVAITKWIGPRIVRCLP